MKRTRGALPRTWETARKRGRPVVGAEERPAPEPGTVLPGGSR
ncbi:hypothetical protein OV450_5032 [Actinobacteria bacterium OV450]|nr:hypothetical protein OV450_5032 [Actinobacteria bacterium OV450]